MNLLFSNHVKIANKWLILLSGLNKKAVNRKGKRTYEYKNFNLPKNWRETKWSKTMIKQIFAYAGLSNSEGDLGIIDLEELAKLLQCSIRSLRNNHKKFKELGLVELEELYGTLVHIKLVNYQNQFLDLYQSDNNEEYKTYTGFTRIKKEVLFEMFKMPNVNLLRIICRALFLHEKEVYLGGHDSILFSSDMLKGFLPTYFAYRPVLERALRKIGHLFEVNFFSMKENKTILLNRYKATPTIIEKFKAPYLMALKLHPNRDSRKIMEEEESKATHYIPVEMNKVYETTQMKPVDFQSVQELVIEYGYNEVNRALDDIIAYYKQDYQNMTQVAVELFNEMKALKNSWEPIGILRKIFRKYALHYQEVFWFES